MHEHDRTEQPTAGATPRVRRWIWPAATTAALLIGVGVGSSGDGSATGDDEALASAEAGRADAEDRAAAAESAASEAEKALASAESELARRAAELDARAADLDSREAAVTATEQQVAASQIDVGVWTVGVDVEPGTYRTTEPVTSSCYWGIYVSGSNQSDIVDNGIVQGGHPTVTLSAGQDFESDCGTWSRQ